MRQKSHQDSLLTNLVIFTNLPYKVGESFVNVNTLFSGSLNEAASKMFGEITSLFTKQTSVSNVVMHSLTCLTIIAYLSLILKIALVGNHDDRERVLVLYPKNLLMESANFLK
jgi:hypothetical protein